MMVEKSLIKKILENPLPHAWTIQGLGMLRLYLDDVHRLHVWDDRYRVDNVSQIHTHPWDFVSTVIAGRVDNVRYVKSGEWNYGREFNTQTIHCGEGGGLVGEAGKIRLFAKAVEIYNEGDKYSEKASEIHLSMPMRGSVTIVERTFKEDTEHAYVFWQEGDWVSAEPRTAHPEEIVDICNNSLNSWFK